VIELVIRLFRNISVLLADKQKKIITLLADGEFHSDTVLADLLGISPAAAYKQLNQLAQELDLNMAVISDKGFQLDRPLELLTPEKIVSALEEQNHAFISALEIHDQIDSTNRYLVEQTRHQAICGLVCFAEQQTAGKGRRGREWVSPFGHNIYLSIAWHYQQSGYATIAGLSLAVGVAVIRALTELQLHGFGLKWPNDIYSGGKKLGGILIEVSGEADGACDVVIGVGLNLFLPESKAETITQAWTDISKMTGQYPSRNVLAGKLLNQLLPLLANYEQQGLKAYLDEWRSYDCFKGLSATLFIAQQTIVGVIEGVNDEGLLLLKGNDGSIQAFASGEVSFNGASV
jgi:BirA family biotin operon repressor/biotin-[acetyl-CoA-carboxylase] ligase